MGTGLTELDIWNGALDILSQTRAITAAEKTAAESDPDAGGTADARWFVRNYGKTLRELLRANVWTFAKDLATVTKDGTAPTHTYSYRYAIPADWVRVLPIRYLDAPAAWERVGGFIHCNLTGPLDLYGIQLMADPDDWDDLFVPVVEAALARKYALKLTGKTDYVRIANDAFERAYEVAATLGAIEEEYETAEAHDIIRVRG